MVRFIIRRLLFAIPTLIVISMVIFAILDFAPGDPTGNLPLTVPQDVKERIRESLGLDQPTHIRYVRWLRQFFVVEPQYIIEDLTGLQLINPEDPDAPVRILSWQTRGPVFDLIFQRMPQTLLILGLAYVFGALLAIPVGVYSAYRQYSAFDNIGTFITMVGYSVPTYFSGLLMIIIFSVQLKWFPSFYDTTLEVTNWETFVQQVKQMIMPVTVLSFFNAAQVSRFMRSSMLDNLNLDYVRTARSKGLNERVVVLIHVLRNSLIPVITLLALQIPGIFGGAIITEQIFKVNGLGQLLITAIQGSDIPTVQTLTFIFAILIVIFNLVADVLYGILDPRIRYD
ncbi:MAG: ABC transporter permease [Ardenticatenaceae bacterium]|nr:ABC transporter permease [Ardenticatenaceae bacterium]